MKNVFLQLKCRFPVFWGGCSPSRGGSPSGGGFSIPGGSPSWGGSPSRGFSIWGGGLHPGGRGALHPGGVYHVTYPIMHLMLPVCCLLTQLRLTNSAAAYIVVVQGMMGYPPPPPLLTESQTPVKT